MTEGNLQEKSKKINPGRFFAGQYLIVDTLGSGSQGIVYQAINLQSEAQVALKVIDIKDDPDRTNSRAFVREFNLALNLSSRYITKVYEAGICGSQLFISMEIAANGTLKSLLSREQLTLEKKISLISQIAFGLIYLHKNLIVHADLKPDNILVSKDKTAKIADFGLSRALNRSCGHALGTPAYMAPEVWLGAEYSPESDVYALGLIAYEIIAEAAAYETNDIKELGKAHILSSPDLSLIPEDLRELVSQAIKKKPTERISSSRFLTELKRLECYN